VQSLRADGNSPAPERDTTILRNEANKSSVINVNLAAEH